MCERSKRETTREKILRKSLMLLYGLFDGKIINV